MNRSGQIVEVCSGKAADVLQSVNVSVHCGTALEGGWKRGDLGICGLDMPGPCEHGSDKHDVAGSEAEESPHHPLREDDQYVLLNYEMDIWKLIGIAV